MQTLHVYSDDVNAQNILRYINELSSNGCEIEILDNKIFEFEQKSVRVALSQIKKNEIYTTDEVLQAIRNAN